MADGFLGRWSQRKLDLKRGKEVEPEPDPPPAVVPAQAGMQGALESRMRGNDEVVGSPPSPPPPTLGDVEALTAESDFSAFTGRGVQPEVSNAAMKKLFSDPHYNVMDGLDIYIDDYSKPDPIPAAMLRQMVSAKFLNLFDDEEKDPAGDAKERPAGAGGGDDADGSHAAAVAQSGLCNQLPSEPAHQEAPASRTDHADPDLRLQQDHAAPGKNPGGGAA
ncbi:MAG: DUF3306 domain-containing protein [Haliea sp.]|nr:MAG: DUF3306 domain-containing protein [Haliea sp.]